MQLLFDKLKALLGVTTDYLLKDEVEADVSYSVVSVEPERSEPLRKVSMEEANTFLDMKRKNAPLIANATSMCIISPALLIILATFADSHVGIISEKLAVGENIIVRVSMIRSGFDTLLQEGGYTKEEKKAQRKMDALSGAYWCIVTAIYLGWSFWTMRWDFTWIVWPVAGVLFAAIHGVMRMVIGSEDKK